MAKHGTTWMQTLVAMLLHGGPALPWTLSERSPFPYYPQCTYLVIYRDPRDAFFSLADHAENIKDAEQARLRRVRAPDAEFQEWVQADRPPELLDAFSLDETLHHLSSSSDLRHLPNVHLFHYADLKRDLPTALDRMRQRSASLAPGAAEPWHDVAQFFAQGRLGGWRGKLSESSLALFEQKLGEALDPELARWLIHGELPKP